MWTFTFWGEGNCRLVSAFFILLPLIWASRTPFPTVSSPMHILLALPRQAFVFWRLTHRAALTGSAEQRSPWESRHLFLCLFECSFKHQVSKSCAHQQQIRLAGETCHLVLAQRCTTVTRAHFFPLSSIQIIFLKLCCYFFLATNTAKCWGGKQNKLFMTVM